RGCESESGTDRDAAHTEIRERRKCEMMIESGNKDVDRFWRDCIYDLRDLVRITNPRRVETLGASFTVRDKSVYYGVQRIGITDQPCFTTAGYHYATLGSVDRRARRSNPFDREFFLIQRTIATPSAVLDRQACNASLDAALHVRCHIFRFICIAR